MSKFDQNIYTDELAECDVYEEWIELRRRESEEAMDADEEYQAEHDEPTSDQFPVFDNIF